jgi:hypothetical protein
MRGRKYYAPKKPNYSALFNEEDEAKLAYMRNKQFHHFVETFEIDNPALLGWSLVDFHRCYYSGGVYEPTLF